MDSDKKLKNIDKMLNAININSQITDEINKKSKDGNNDESKKTISYFGQVL